MPWKQGEMYANNTADAVWNMPTNNVQPMAEMSQTWREQPQGKNVQKQIKNSGNIHRGVKPMQIWRRLFLQRFNQHGEGKTFGLKQYPRIRIVTEKSS